MSSLRRGGLLPHVSSSVFHIIWPDGETSQVAISTGMKGDGRVTIDGKRDPLLAIADYKKASAMEAELRYIVRRCGARIDTGFKSRLS